EAKAAAGRHWKGTETPFDRLAAVSEWMRSVQKGTPPAEPGGRELRRLAFESGADEFGMLVRFAEAAEGLNLGDAFQTALDSRSTSGGEADGQEERVSALDWIVRNGQLFGMRPKQPIAALRNALNMRTEAKTLRQQMAADIMATNACATLAGK